MNIDKKGFRYRLSNVLSWSALGGIALGIILGDGFDVIMATIWLWLSVGVINYLMMGSLRLLPWRDIEGKDYS
jgi:hypothetical protein